MKNYILILEPTGLGKSATMINHLMKTKVEIIVIKN